ncbi:glycosyltransferase [Tenacibaculum sp. C7A-26P2]|uniref:glycosyltransferase n=1 Tax=Tenacibaculum sp. C7A-26P2 TaxID=3447504 RepID=UPI003F857011
MKTNFIYDLVIVIPCYNEQDRLPVKKFQSFTKLNSEILICFVNDGSKDDTEVILSKLQKEHPNTITQLSLKDNIGKAEAIRKGFLYCNTTYNYKKIAYLDADLATSLEECISISNYIKNDVILAFGSRISKIDNNIDRKFYRFAIGRFIATLISRQLKVTVYDTQCGCKAFEQNVASEIFKDHFISKWLFDVEIFHRIITTYQKQNVHKIVREIPLKSWVDTDDSRVKFSYFFKLWFDLLAIRKKYKK